MHRNSHSNASYQRQFNRQPLAFCQACHAPEADPLAKIVPATLSEMGVGCVTCHVQNDAIISVTGARANATPHALKPTAELGTAAACAACHQFPFPSSLKLGVPTLMQSTIQEHQGSPFSAASCAQCHMPFRNGHRNHTFAVTQDDVVIQNAVSVGVARTGARIAFRLASRGVGHAVPTGDLFRRIALRAEVVDLTGKTLESQTRYLSRHFGFMRGSDGQFLKMEVGDDRLPATGEVRSVAMVFGDDATSQPIRYRVSYQRVDLPTGVQEEQAHVESEVVLAQGVLPTSEVEKE